MGTPIDNNLSQQMGNVNPNPVPDPASTPAAIPAPPDPQPLHANIPALANHIEVPSVDPAPTATPAVDPITVTPPVVSDNNVQYPAPVVANDLGMAPVQATISPNNVAQSQVNDNSIGESNKPVSSAVTEPINAVIDLQGATPVTSAPASPSLVDQPFVESIQPVVNDQNTQTPHLPTAPTIGTQVIGGSETSVASVLNQSVPVESIVPSMTQSDTITSQVNPINIELPTVDNNVVEPSLPVPPTIMPVVETQNEVVPVQDKVSTINVSPNNIPIEQLPTAASIIDQPVTNQISTSIPVVDSSVPPAIGNLDLVNEIINEGTSAPVDTVPMPKDTLQPNVGVVNYNNVDAGLNAVVHNTQAPDTAGVTLSDLVQESKAQAGVYEAGVAQSNPESPASVVQPTVVADIPQAQPVAIPQPAQSTMQPEVSSVPADTVVAQEININPIAVATEAVLDQPAMQLNNVDTAQSPAPVVESVLHDVTKDKQGPSPVITNDASMAPNTLPPLENTAPHKKKKGKSILVMVGLIIVFLAFGVVLLYVGLKMSNSFELPFAISFLDSLIPTN